MPRPPLIPLLLLALCLPGCASPSGPDGGSSCHTGVPFSIGTEVIGEIRRTDCPNPTGAGFVDYHEFTLETAGPVAIEVSTLAMPGPMYVALFDGDGMLVDSSALYPVVFSNAVGGSLPAGTYTVAVGMSAGTSGTYSMRSYRELAPPRQPYLECTISSPYTPGTEVAGALTSGDCFDRESYWDLYHFTLGSRTTITIDLRTRWFLSELYLFDANGVLLAQGYGPDINTRDSHLAVSLPGGDYYIGVAAYLYGARGSYSLVTRGEEAAAGAMAGRMPGTTPATPDQTARASVRQPSSNITRNAPREGSSMTWCTASGSAATSGSSAPAVPDE